MRDIIVPGGVTPRHRRHRQGGRSIQARWTTSACAFPRWSNSTTTPPRCRIAPSTPACCTPALAEQYAAGGYVGRASGRAFDARRNARLSALRQPALRRAGADRGRRQRAGLDPDPRGRAEPVADRPDPGPAAGRPDCWRRCRRAPEAREGMAMVEGFRGDVLVWLRLRDGRIERCHLRDPSWFQWPLLEAAIEDNIVADFPLCNKSFNCSYSGARSVRAAMRKLLFESLFRTAAHRSGAVARRRRGRRTRRARSATPRGDGSAAACRSARSMPAPATAASWKSTRSTTPITTSSASACASSPRRAMPTCCWSPDR